MTRFEHVCLSYYQSLELENQQEVMAEGQPVRRLAPNRPLEHHRFGRARHGIQIDETLRGLLPARYNIFTLCASAKQV
jgi:hypothetical protein